MNRLKEESHSCSSGAGIEDTEFKTGTINTFKIMKRDIASTATETTADIAQLAEDARTLLAATAQVAEQKVVDARKRVMSALEQGWDAVSEKTMAGCRATDDAIREHPYQALGTALGVGALVGFLLARR